MSHGVPTPENVAKSLSDHIPKLGHQIEDTESRAHQTDKKGEQ
jgi:hypothetical protein